MAFIEHEDDPLNDARLAARGSGVTAGPNEVSFNTPSGWEFLGTSIDAKRWNQSFPFQLLRLNLTESAGKNSYTLDNATTGVSSTFTLPIPPEAVSFSTPYANVLYATLGGVVETHNGAPIRDIQISGTTGVLPLRGHGAGRSNTIAHALFGSTIRSAQNVLTEAAGIMGAPPKTNTVEDIGPDAVNLMGTGYYQFRLLSRWLEKYAEDKASGKFPKLRLGFAVYKEQAIYLVSPVHFTVSRSANSALEYPYSLAFKVWGRANVNISVSANRPFQPAKEDRNVLLQGLAAITSARSVLNSGRRVIEAAGADVNFMMREPLREVGLLLKDALGLGLTAAELPASIISGAADFRDAVFSNFGSLEATFRNMGDHITAAFNEAIASMTDKPMVLGAHQVRAVTLPGETTPPVLPDPIEPGDEVTPTNVMLNFPDEYPALMDAIEIGKLPLSAPTVRMIEAEKARVRNLGPLDLAERRDRLLALEAELSEQWTEPDDEQWQILWSLALSAQTIDGLTVTEQGESVPPRLEVVANQMSRSGMVFEVPQGKVGVPFAGTLETMANRYLGSPDRWMEIAELNGLRDPYIDEVGRKVPVLLSGGESTVVVDPAHRDFFFAGQAVTIESGLVPARSFRVTAVTLRGSGLHVSLDSASSDYPPGSTLHGYARGTTNSQQFVFVPSAEAPELGSFFTKDVPGVDELDEWTRIGGADWLLTDSGDLAVTDTGVQLAVGLRRLVQRFKVACTTRKGSLLHHPGFGLGLEPGINHSDVTAQQVREQLEGMVQGDPYFSGVESLSVLKRGPQLRMAATVQVKGVDKTLPIGVDLTL